METDALVKEVPVHDFKMVVKETCAETHGYQPPQPDSMLSKVGFCSDMNVKSWEEMLEKLEAEKLSHLLKSTEKQKLF